jgi:hypothetical protein
MLMSHPWKINKTDLTKLLNENEFNFDENEIKTIVSNVFLTKDFITQIQAFNYHKIFVNQFAVK